MHNLSSPKPEGEIDLRELFIALWAYKFFIAIICVLSVFCSGYYSLNSPKEFTSSAIFNLNSDDSNSAMFSGQSSAFAGLAALSGQSNKLDLPTDMVMGRIFIEKIDNRLNFQTDPYFNSYNPDAVEPAWKSLIKRSIGWRTSTVNIQDLIWHNIISVYTNNIELSNTPDGSAKITVKHTNPQRAAEISNVIMDEIISIDKQKKTEELNKRLSYMSNSLAKALSDLEIAQSNLKKFAMENSALPLEDFTFVSLQLDKLREELSRTSELHEAVAALLLILQNNTINQNSYLELRQQFPIVDQVEFRRILGQSEIISSWSWPKLSSVGVVFDTLTERENILIAKINASLIDAERFGTALDDYAKLKREEVFSGALHTVLMEQVKSQSMAAGYKPNTSEVYEYAVAAINPSAPNRKLIIALGATLGFFLGTALSLLIVLYRGVCYSKSSLIGAAQARYSGSCRELLPLRNKNLNDLGSIIVKKPRSILRELAVEIHKNNAQQVVLTSSNAKMTGNNLARALASYMQSSSSKIAVIDFSSKIKKLDINDKELTIGSFVISENVKHISVLRPKGDLEAIEMLSQKDFREYTQFLNSTFDLIFLCADNKNAISLLSALEDQKMHHISIARTRKTKSLL